MRIVAMTRTLAAVMVRPMFSAATPVSSESASLYSVWLKSSTAPATVASKMTSNATVTPSGATGG
eukprot:scaffold191747_cov27-Tisochrysis_lutea.AAC.2